VDPEPLTAATVVEPRSIVKLEPAARRTLHELQAVALELRQAEERQRRLVRALRNAGAPWSAVGWAVGTSGEAARQRWNTEKHWTGEDAR